MQRPSAPPTLAQSLERPNTKQVGKGTFLELSKNMVILSVDIP